MPRLKCDIENRKTLRIISLGLSPYDGVVFHETPLSLLLFSFLSRSLPSWLLSRWLWVCGDLLTAAILSRLGSAVASSSLSRQRSEMAHHHPESAPLLLPASLVTTLPHLMTIFYLFNPYIIANCAARTTTVWSNLFLSVFLLSLARCRRVSACVALSLASYQSLYPAMLLLPLSLQLARDECGSLAWPVATNSYIKTVSVFLSCLMFLLLVSSEITGSWTFLYSTYGFILSVPELTPNMGLFWYVFLFKMHLYFSWERLYELYNLTGAGDDV